MSVIDFHSHVLPRIDDGSHSSEESLGMLQISASQGIDVMAATSHFYATEDRISSFLNRRRCSEERLKERMNQELTKEERIPRLIMGAEVAFFTGISRAERLEELTYEGTDLLLLEMPFTKWNKSEIEEVRYILERRKLRVMLAHLERFLMIPGNKKKIYELMELPVYVQINAGSFERWGERRQILKMIRKKEQIFLGSDCHGLNHIINAFYFKCQMPQAKCFRIIYTGRSIFYIMYCLSSFTTSSKSVMLLRPLTCHIPVSPGLVARRAR